MALGLARFVYILWVSEKRDSPKIAVYFENDDRYPCFKHAHMMVQEQRNVITPSFPAKNPIDPGHVVLSSSLQPVLWQRTPSSFDGGGFNGPPNDTGNIRGYPPHLFMCFDLRHHLCGKNI